MKKFSDFGLSEPGFIGPKIGIDEVLNKEIEVHKYRVEKSKFPKPGYEECVHMQIKFEGVDRVLFSGSKVLTETIQKVPELPFLTTIIKPGKHLQFT